MTSFIKDHILVDAALQQEIMRRITVANICVSQPLHTADPLGLLECLAAKRSSVYLHRCGISLRTLIYPAMSNQEQLSCLNQCSHQLTSAAVKGEFNYVSLLGNAWLLVNLLGVFVDTLLFLHDASKPVEISANAIATAGVANEIRRGRNPRRGVRGTAGHALAGCEPQVESFGWARTRSNRSVRRDRNGA